MLLCNIAQLLIACAACSKNRRLLFEAAPRLCC